MARLSDELALEYRAATLLEIRSWSFGEVRAVRDPSARTWTQIRGTLDDEAIFGTRRDYQCACGKFQGTEYERLICDRCGVKVASHEHRHTRFGHIVLAYPIPHPLVEPTSTLDAIPVLPASFWESAAGAQLASSYEEVFRANQLRDPHRIIEAVGRVFEILLPVVEMAHKWRLQDTPILASGLALVPRIEEPDPWDAPSIS
ncbi:MAG TPA: hypothetical protein VGZ22_01800 [Isosphaeraceae bacterium]|nr:hypothetical protein [Isosphaeraceae bacterium]